jgi:site-specific recombinase
MSVLQVPQTRDLVLSFFPLEKRGESDVHSLVSLLDNFLDAPDLPSQLDALVQLKEWTAKSGPSPLEGSESRLEAFLSLMEARNQLRIRFQQVVREMLPQIRSVDSFAESGLHPREGLWSETVRRMTQRILPSAREDYDLSGLTLRLYPTRKAVEGRLELSDETFERMARTLAPVDDETAWPRQIEDLKQAVHLLAVHIAGLGLSPDLRARSHLSDIEQSPFYQLQQSTADLINKTGSATALELWRTQVQRVRDELEYVHIRMEDTGVSTSLVFDMRTIEHALSRMECIVVVLFLAEPHEHIRAVKLLLDEVMLSRSEDLSVRALFRDNTALLARKIVERTGKAGTHYIANSRSEYRGIWKASLGGGLLTVLTAAIKMRIVGAHLPPFVEGIAAGANYAVSFILLQHFHLALATKQPSVTAAAFAGIVRTTHGRERLQELSEFISRITRSQLASAAGNLIAVGLGCVLFARLWVYFFSRPYLEVPSAEHVYQTLDPITSGTMIYAILTGIILWISALAGGWFENYATYNRIPAAIAQHPLGHRIGQNRMKRLSEVVDTNISGWVTCIVLGLLLGFTPAVGEFFGIPLDVRHVTLNTGTLALAAASFGRDWLYRGWFLHTLYGIALTFVLNLGVSFSIAAYVGMKAHGVSKAERFELMTYTLKSFFKSPRRFFLPPRDGPKPDEPQSSIEAA